MAKEAADLAALAGVVASCRACPRLVEWRERVAREKRASFAAEDYWGRPVPGFGDPGARVLVVGLAPAAHGGNRTGRIFTGDRSGDFLFASMYRCGLANQPESTGRDDGLALQGAYVTAAVRCAPPGNKPDPDERDRCHPYLVRELDLLTGVRVIVSLGSFAWGSVVRAHLTRGGDPVRPTPRFGHAATVDLGTLTVIGCYHPSQQNTFTGKLTESMMDDVFTLARRIAEI
ncbi:MAG: uracil-DNA glycosylase [Actinomycetota bacterium]